MKEEMITFLENERFGSIATQLLNGDPHVATVHFAFIPETFEIIIQTNPASRKYERLAQEGSCRASFTTGFEEVKTIVAQFDGEVSTGITEEQKQFYLQKFPEKVGKYKTEVFIVFKPDWWRYTDWTKLSRKTILSSNGLITVSKK